MHKITKKEAFAWLVNNENALLGAKTYVNGETYHEALRDTKEKIEAFSGDFYQKAETVKEHATYLERSGGSRLYKNDYDAFYIHGDYLVGIASHANSSSLIDPDKVFINAVVYQTF